MAFAAALFAHEPVDVVLGSVVWSGHLENVGNAEQRLPRVPICYRLKQTNTFILYLIFLIYDNIYLIQKN